MSNSIDAAGNIHDSKGQFAGHVQSEADTSAVLAPPRASCPSMVGATIDGSGFCSAHGWDCGDFALAKAGAVRDEQAERERAASAELDAALEALTAAEKVVVKASLTGTVARLRQVFPNMKRLVLVNNDEGSWQIEIDSAVEAGQPSDPDELVPLFDIEFDDDTLEDHVWQWTSGIDSRKPSLLEPYCVGPDGDELSYPEGLDTDRRTGEVARAEINLALFD